MNSVLPLTFILVTIAFAAIEAVGWWTTFGGKSSRRIWAIATCLIIMIGLFLRTSFPSQFDWSCTIELAGLTAGLMALALYNE